jgi:hypothetical protein
MALLDETGYRGGTKDVYDDDVYDDRRSHSLKTFGCGWLRWRAATRSTHLVSS